MVGEAAFNLGSGAFNVSLSSLTPLQTYTVWVVDGSESELLPDLPVGLITFLATGPTTLLTGLLPMLPLDFTIDRVVVAPSSLFGAEPLGAGTVGKTLFLNGTGSANAGGRCSACHANAGAIATNGQNRNFNTNVEDLFHPARTIQDFPKDGGFGRTNNGDGTFGNRAFNTASVVEAAESAPFFHNNVVETLEGVMDFYTLPEFNNPRAAAARFAFTQTQRDRIADFMRGICRTSTSPAASCRRSSPTGATRGGSRTRACRRRSRTRRTGSTC